MPIFYRQEKGLLIPPDGVEKWHVSWTLDNILSGFKKFYEEKNRWPLAVDMKICKYLPNVKTLDRKFGGITNIRKELGLPETNLTKGKTRSIKAAFLQKQGFNAEQDVYNTLAEYYHEPFVHNQARVVVNNHALKVDFIVYHNKGKYAVDVFFPDKETSRFRCNVNMKLRTYTNFPFKIYLCVFNPEITKSDVMEANSVLLKHSNRLVEIVLLSEFQRLIYDYTPLKDPFSV